MHHWRVHLANRLWITCQFHFYTLYQWVTSAHTPPVPLQVTSQTHKSDSPFTCRRHLRSRTHFNLFLRHKLSKSQIIIRPHSWLQNPHISIRSFVYDYFCINCSLLKLLFFHPNKSRFSPSNNKCHLNLVTRQMHTQLGPTVHPHPHGCHCAALWTFGEFDFGGSLHLFPLLFPLDTYCRH